MSEKRIESGETGYLGKMTSLQKDGKVLELYKISGYTNGYIELLFFCRWLLSQYVKFTPKYFH